MYFEALKNEQGLNLIADNPCELLNFGKLVLPPGEKYAGNTGEYEVLLVVLGGEASIEAGGVAFSDVGARPSVFAGKPHSVYLPPDCSYTLAIPEGTTPFEAALPMAKAQDGTAPFLIEPSQVVVGKWGISNFSQSNGFSIG